MIKPSKLEELNIINIIKIIIITVITQKKSLKAFVRTTRPTVLLYFEVCLSPNKMYWYALE